jgi:N-methylhydantoinase A
LTSYAVGVDIGGTFTDLVLVGTDGSRATHKLPSTPDDYGRGIVTGLEALLSKVRGEPAAITHVVHGTTVATNAILELRGASTALITTKGFRDVLEIQRIRIPELYNLFYEKPPPLVPRARRFEVEERSGPDGSVWRPLSIESVERAVQAVADSGAEAVAVCLLHAYANPVHERTVCERVRARLPGLYVTASSELLPEIREYERTSTTVINAYLGPIVESYMRSLVERLRELGVSGQLLVMQSNGGVMTVETAIQRPAQLVESGPAAGVTAVAQLACETGFANCITLDMGGTTAKASLVENAEVALTSEYEVGGGINVSSMMVKGGGYPLKVPTIDIAEIGAGGGSIVWIDKGGRLQLGPQSAGAIPGPVCYDAGGDEPTLTDANAVLGFINPESLAGGSLPLNTPKAAEAIEQKIADPLGLSLLEAAHGVYRLAAASMVRAVKAVSTYRGRDPRDFTLVAFGGNGPICAVEMAALLGVEKVLIPPAAGLFSALGLLHSKLEYQLVGTYMQRADALAFAGPLRQAYADLAGQALAALRSQGFGDERVVLERFADMRYADQGYELTIPVSADQVESDDPRELVEKFAAEHVRSYGHRAEDEPVDFVNLRVTAQLSENGSRPFDPLALAELDSRAGESARNRDVYFGTEHGTLETEVVGRMALTEEPLAGPLVIEEYDVTSIVPPGSAARLDAAGNIVMELPR